MVTGSVAFLLEQRKQNTFDNITWIGVLRSYLIFHYLEEYIGRQIKMQTPLTSFHFYAPSRSGNLTSIKFTNSVSSFDSGPYTTDERSLILCLVSKIDS